MPPEIRNEIYELVLLENETYSVVSPSKRKPETHNTALLRVNKLFYQEGSPYLYINNAFHFGNGRWGSTEEVNLHALKYFFERVPVKHRVLITKVHIDIFLHKSMWTQTIAEGEEEQRDLSNTDLLTYNGFPDVDDALRMVSKIMMKLPSLQEVNLKWYNAWRSRKEPSSEVELSYWDFWSGSANAIGSTAILRMLMGYTGHNLTEIRMPRRQAVFLRLAMRGLCKEFPASGNAADGCDSLDAEQPDVCEAASGAIQGAQLSAALSVDPPQTIIGAGKIIKVYGRHCQSHEIVDPKDLNVHCQFDYSEECLADSMVMSDKYWG